MRKMSNAVMKKERGCQGLGVGDWRDGVRGCKVSVSRGERILQTCRTTTSSPQVTMRGCTAKKLWRDWIAGVLTTIKRKKEDASAFMWLGTSSNVWQ